MKMAFDAADADLRIESNWLLEENQNAYAVFCDELELTPGPRRPEGVPVPSPSPRKLVPVDQ